MDMSKVLCPYETETESGITSYTHTIYFRRSFYGNQFPKATVYKSFYYSRGWLYDMQGMAEPPSISDGEFLTAEDAMAACDKRLLELGYTLLTKEQYEKLQVLK